MLDDPNRTRLRAGPPAGSARAGAGSPTRRFLADLAKVAVALTLAWWALVLVVQPPPFMLPGPDRVARAFLERGDYLATNAAVTLAEIAIGLVVGVALGLATALTMSLFPATRALVLPLVVVVQSLPVFAIAPVLVLWFGFGLASKIVMAALVIFFPVASAFHDGLERTDPHLLDLARLYRASALETLALVRVPAALPAFVTGLRMAASLAPVGAVAGEWVGASQGLGLVMLHANARLQTELMFAAFVLVAAMAVILRLLVDILARRLVPWAEGPERDA